MQSLLSYSFNFCKVIYKNYPCTFCCSSHSSPIKKLSKKRKAVIDDDENVDEPRTRNGVDDFIDVASLHDDSDADDVC